MEHSIRQISWALKNKISSMGNFWMRRLLKTKDVTAK